MNLNLPFSRGRSCTVRATTFAIAVIASSLAMAMPPHPNDAGKIAFGTAATNHSHVGGIGVKTVNPSAIGIAKDHMVDSAAVETWRSYAAWDNRTYRATDQAGTTVYGHGYIEPSDATRPRYAFGANTPGGQDLTSIQSSITFAWQTWETAAKAQGQNSRFTPDGTPLLTNLSFRQSNVDDGGAKEIDIDFSGTTPGVWNAVAQTLRFAPSISDRIFVSDATGNPNPDWQVSSDNLALNGAKAWGAQTPSITLPWNFTAAAPTTTGVPNGGDLDYKCVKVGGCGAGAAQNSVFEGTEAAFIALGLKVADSVGGAVINASDTPIVQADFRSVAMHEWGHVLGLDHVDPTTATMYAFSPFTLGVLTRSVDVGSAKGAAVLYSIPIPEPATLLTVLMAAMCVGGCRRRWN